MLWLLIINFWYLGVSSSPTRNAVEFSTPLERRTGSLLLPQLDSSFCTLSYHSSLLVDNQLFLTNGEQLYRKGQQPLSNVWAIDMSQSWNVTEGPVLLTNISQPSGNYPASRTCNSAIWSNESDLVMFGGERYFLENSRVLPAQMYDYDITAQAWDSASNITVATDSNLTPRACGSYAQSDAGVGYYLGGYKSADNDPSVADTRCETGMLAVNLANSSASTLTTTRLTTKIDGQGTNIGGQMNFIGSVGKQGILVAVGGLSLQTTANFSWSPAPTLDLYNDMSDIAVFDIESETWYHQTAFSADDVGVDARVQFCSAVVSAPDNSSHHIYIYGGYNTEKNYDTVHVLSIPLFQWSIAAAPNSYVSRFVHTCNIVGNRQFLVTGGTQKPVNNNNVVTDGQRPCTSAKLFQLFDLTTHDWTNYYNASAESYEVNADLVALIGGSPTGGATAQDPVDGWTDPDLKAIFKTVNTSNSTSSNTTSPSTTPTGTTSPSKPRKSKTSVGIIIGAVVAALVIIAAIVATYFFCTRRRKQNDGQPIIPELPSGEQSVELPAKVHMAELPSKIDYAELPGERWSRI